MAEQWEAIFHHLDLVDNDYIIIDDGPSQNGSIEVIQVRVRSGQAAQLREFVEANGMEEVGAGERVEATGQRTILTILKNAVSAIASLVSRQEATGRHGGQQHMLNLTTETAALGNEPTTNSGPF